MALPSNALLTVDTAQDWIPGLSSETTADVERLIGAASATADRIARRALAAADYVETTSGNGSRVLLLEHRPIQSVSLVEIDGSGVFGSGSEVEDFDQLDDAGILERRSGWPNGYRNIRASYRAGYELASTPADLQAAVAEIVQWMHRRIAEQSIGIRTITSPDGINTAFDLDVPLAARNVLAGYREAVL